MKNALSFNFVHDIKINNVKRIATNPNYKQMHVNRIMSGQIQSLSLQIYAPIWEIKNRMKSWGMISPGGFPKASGAIFRYHDISIIEYYKRKALGFLSYYRPAVNYYNVKKLADYHLRWSLLHTLAGKYKSKIHEIIKKYGKTPKIILIDKGKEWTLASYLTPNVINHRDRGFTLAHDPFVEFENLDKPLVKLSMSKALFSKRCAIMDCQDTNIEVHNIRALKRVCRSFITESVRSKNKILKEKTIVEPVISRKQIPLCKHHHTKWHHHLTIPK